MKISKFHLINDGFTGVAVESVESIIQDNITILDKVSRLRTYPVPDYIRSKIIKLKYFYLNLTHHWIDPYDKCFDMEKYDFITIPEGQEAPKSYYLLQSLMNHTKITGVSLKNAGFCITGSIEAVEGKKIGVATPYVTEEDDVSFFTEAMDKIEEIMEDIAGLLKSAKALPFNEKEALKSKGFKDEDIEGYSKQEMIDMVIEGLQDKGAIVLMNPDGSEPEAITDGTAKSTLHQKSGSIDSHRVPDAIEHTEETKSDEVVIAEVFAADAKKKKARAKVAEELSEETPVILPEEKKPIGKGSLVSEGKFPDLETGQIRAAETIPEGSVPEDMEYSANMGIQDPESQVNTQGEW